jgi:hypothetical protein
MADVIWTGETDGDYATATNWSTGSVPAAGDNVFFTSDYNVSVTTGLDQSGTTIANFTVDGFTGKIGSKSAYLQISLNGSVNFNGSDQVYLDIGSSAVDVSVTGSSSTTGTPGLMLLGTAIDDLSITNGNIGLAFNPGETATVTAIKMIGGNLEIGDGCTLTSANIQGGNLTTKSTITTITIYTGSLTLDGAAAVTTLNSNGGSVAYSSTGNITTLNLSGAVDCSQSLMARTIATLAPAAGGSITYDPSVVTITTKSAPTLPIVETYTNGF